ncbi:MAG: class I SAM-dependent methyltransferase [Alphaproteobacteria bacterium]|nr:MAG: class I SAM-dependent methyltransferase [Alphaproteobacteria bacterium]
MAEANAHYYATRDPLGLAGDFTTAPEISQMFGELVGLWLADLWQRSGAGPAAYVELGPGRGTLAADALRAMRGAGLMPDVHFVETSPVLRDAQRQRHPDAQWHDSLATLPTGTPLLVVANEFFDALPIRQLVRTEAGWHERLVTVAEGGFAPMPGPRVPAAALPASAPPGTIVETSPASLAIARQLAARLIAQGGAALIVDYGHTEPSAGETLQAVSAHAYADPWSEPGERDLTAHVDFAALAASVEGLTVHGPVGQGEWLEAMGISVRAEALAHAAPERATEIDTARRRLTEPDQMGTLFKALAFTAPNWPLPAGFPS